MSTRNETIAGGFALLRRNGRGIGLELLVNFVLPYLVYDLARPHLGDVKALMASSGPPILWSLIVFARKRQVDFISGFVLAGIALSLLAMLGGGSVKFLQLREKLVTGLIGLGFLVSALIGKPMIYEFAKAGMKRSQSAQLANFEARRNHPGFRRAMTLMTVVWGLGLLADVAVSAALVMMLTIKQYLIAGPIVGYGCLGALSIWTFLYSRSRQRVAAAREASEAEAARRAQPPGSGTAGSASGCQVEKA
jgi:hypothetical protein